MALMVAEIYDALREAGVSEEKARQAAEAVALGDQRLAQIEGRLSTLEGRMTALDGRLAGVEGRLTTLQWIVGIGFSALLALNLLTLSWMWQLLQRLPVKTP